MTRSSALVPNILAKTNMTFAANALSVLLGIALVSVLAQIKVALPWTPVPITGQTFGVAFMALLWGRQRGLLVMLGYLGVGAAGLPVFASAQAGLSYGPTLGYLLGMCVSAYWIGFLADSGFTRTFLRSWLAVASGSLITFAFGSLVLAQFVGWNSVLAMGVLPFLPGDIIKSVTASFLSMKLRTKI